MEKITLTGNIGQDAELKEYSGSKFVTFSVACTVRRKNGQETKEITNWYDCSTDNLKLFEFLKKGTKVYIRGNFKLDIYYSEKLGKWLPKINVFAQEIELLSAKKEDAPPVVSSEQGGENKEDLPF